MMDKLWASTPKVKPAIVEREVAEAVRAARAVRAKPLRKKT